MLQSASEDGASAWLTSLPIGKQGFALSKQEFCDALFMRYGFDLKRLPSSCVCGASFSVEHALSCKVGGFVIRRHNDIRDTFATLLQSVAKEVEIEPQLTPLTGEIFQRRTTTMENDARSDIAARDFWAQGVKTFFDVRVFNPIAPSYRSLQPEKNL